MFQWCPGITVGVIFDILNNGCSSKDPKNKGFSKPSVFLGVIFDRWFFFFPTGRLERLERQLLEKDVGTWGRSGWSLERSYFLKDGRACFNRKPSKTQSFHKKSTPMTGFKGAYG